MSIYMYIYTYNPIILVVIILIFVNIVDLCIHMIGYFCIFRWTSKLGAPRLISSFDVAIAALVRGFLP